MKKWKEIEKKKKKLVPKCCQWCQIKITILWDSHSIMRQIESQSYQFTHLRYAFWCLQEIKEAQRMKDLCSFNYNMLSKSRFLLYSVHWFIYCCANAYKNRLDTNHWHRSLCGNVSYKTDQLHIEWQYVRANTMVIDLK